MLILFLVKLKSQRNRFSYSHPLFISSKNTGFFVFLNSTSPLNLLSNGTTISNSLSTMSNSPAKQLSTIPCLSPSSSLSTPQHDCTFFLYHFFKVILILHVKNTLESPSSKRILNKQSNLSQIRRTNKLMRSITLKSSHKTHGQHSPIVPMPVYPQLIPLSCTNISVILMNYSSSLEEMHFYFPFSQHLSQLKHFDYSMFIQNNTVDYCRCLL